MHPSTVHELRLVVTVDDFDATVHLYRDVLGLPAVSGIDAPQGRIVILEAGRATLEIVDPEHAAYVDGLEVQGARAGNRQPWGADHAGAVGTAGVDGTAGADGTAGVDGTAGAIGVVRVALGVDDVDEATDRVAEAGLRVLGAPTRMPWGSRNSRVAGSGPFQLTLFEHGT